MASMVLLAACNSQKQPAEAAFAQIEASVTPVAADLEKYAPEEFAQLSALIEAMKAKLNAKDYANALAAREQIMKQLVAVSSAAGKRKNELQQQLAAQWKELAVSMPGLLSQFNARVGYLQGVGKLPANISASVLQRAVQTMQEVNVEWTAASTAADRRDVVTAVDKAQAIKKRIAEVGAAIGLKPAA
ncbi:MAG: hypothetical protein QM808_12595 [Steroidobacteraceae bacterium]